MSMRNRVLKLLEVYEGEDCETLQGTQLNEIMNTEF